MKRWLLIPLLFCCVAASIYLPHRRAAFRVTDDFSPTDVAGLVCWANNDTLSGSNGDLKEWSDSSGNAYDWSNGAATKPYLTNNVVNGLSALRYTASQYLTNVFASKSQPNCIFIVLMMDNTGATKYAFDGRSAAGEHGLYGNFSETLYLRGGSSLVGSPLVVGNWYVVRGEYNGLSSAIYTNSVLMVSGNSGTEAIVGSVMGGAYTLGFNYSGEIAELLFYDNVPAAGNIVLIENYLKSKFGL